jgi:hypothetical protein
MLSQVLRISLFIIIGVSILPKSVFAADPVYSVFDIKKTIPLNSHQKVYRDFYVNLGADQGAKAGSILAVYRRQGVVDYYRNTLHEDLLVPVAHMKVIQAGKTMSVARMESVTPSKQIPVVEFNSIMLGDRVELVAENTVTKKTTRKVASRNTN